MIFEFIFVILVMMFFLCIVAGITGGVVFIMYQSLKNESKQAPTPVPITVYAPVSIPAPVPAEKTYMDKLNEIFIPKNYTPDENCAVSGYACRDGEYEERAEEISYDDDDECYIPYHLRCDDEEENNDNVFTVVASFLGVDNDDGVDNAFTVAAEFFGAYDDVWF